NSLKPHTVVIDPISNFIASGSNIEVKALLVRMFDMLKARHITFAMTVLNSGSDTLETTSMDVSSLIDTWIQVRNLEAFGERNRVLSIVKARGIPHSNQVREFHIDSDGISLTDVYLGADDIFTGSGRLAQEANARSRELER